MVTSEQGTKVGPLAALCQAVFAGRFARLRTRSGRRWLSIVYLAVTVAFPLVAYAVGEVWAVMLVLAPFAIASFLIAGATGALFDKPLYKLDERERYLRQTVFANPYFTGAAIGLAGGLIVAAALDQPEPVMAGWVLGVIAFVFGLPNVIICWTLPEETGDEG